MQFEAEDIQAFIIDMDGVLWHGEQALPGLVQFFQILRKLQIPFILATNNARQTPQQYVNKLASMGVQVNKQEILTSAMATARFLSINYKPQETRVYVIGENGALEALSEQGYTLTDTINFNHRNPDKEINNKAANLVVCGLDKKLSWEKLATATLHINNGAEFIATNADSSLPTEFGMAPGNGATLAALQESTGKSAKVIGKPEPIMYQQAIQQLGTAPEHTVAIGDRLNTDILGAVRSNISSIMVLTGVSTELDVQQSDYQPTWIMPDIRFITAKLQSRQ